jgi:RES domain-containing protein
MLCYRIAPRKNNNLANALTGLGGMYAEGRWHFIGSPIVYAASFRSLAMLERLVNDSTDILTKDLTVTTFLIPDDLKIKRLVATELPEYWDEHPYISDTQKLGSDWLQHLDTVILQVPSSLCSDEYNYLINPLHPDAKSVKCIDCSTFTYPRRLASKL